MTIKERQDYHRARLIRAQEIARKVRIETRRKREETRLLQIQNLEKQIATFDSYKCKSCHRATLEMLQRKLALIKK